jgi:hypothetical protein
LRETTKELFERHFGFLNKSKLLKEEEKNTKPTNAETELKSTFSFSFCFDRFRFSPKSFSLKDLDRGRLLFG